jgi:hypothetical protein
MFSCIPPSAFPSPYHSCVFYFPVQISVKGPFVPSEKLTWENNMAFLSPGGASVNEGKVGHELGALLSEMVATVVQSYQGDVDYLKSLSEGEGLAPEKFSPGLMAAPHSADFADLLRAGKFLFICCSFFSSSEIITDHFNLP